MITLLRNTARRHVQDGHHHIWFTFFPREHQHSPADGFGILTAFNEIQLPPEGVSTHHPHEDSEIITYMYRGAFAQETSTGSSGVLHTGEFQRMTPGQGIRHRETNISHTSRAHVFRLSLHPSEAGLGCAHEQKRFAAAQRHNVLCVIASPDGRKGSLPILQDSVIYSSVLDPGHHHIHELLPGRSAWFHVIHGEVILQDIILGPGDGAGVTLEPAVSFTAQENTEILLVDLGPPPRSFASRAPGQFQEYDGPVSKQSRRG